MGKTISLLFSLFLILSNSAYARLDSVSQKLASEKGCLTCHEGIEQFTDGPMMAAIKAFGTAYKDPGRLRRLSWWYAECHVQGEGP